MGNYSENEASCRVDFFKDSGKWYTTEVIIFDSRAYDNWSIHEALHRLLSEQMGDRLKDMTVICLEPYHKNTHPISLIHAGKSP